MTLGEIKMLEDLLKAGNNMTGFIASSASSFLSSLNPVELFAKLRGFFVSNGLPFEFFLVAMLALFIFVCFKLFSSFMTGLKIAVISALFPVVLNMLGYSIQLSVENLLGFANLGLMLYVCYLAIRAAGGLLRALTWPFRKIIELVKH